jgi:hypothetical protein
MLIRWISTCGGLLSRGAKTADSSFAVIPDTVNRITGNGEKWDRSNFVRRTRHTATSHLSGCLKGADQPLKDYYIFINPGLSQYITKPCMSMANGKLWVQARRFFRTAQLQVVF